MGVKKILISGFISDNFLSISGFLEKVGFKKPEIEKKVLHMLKATVLAEDLKHLTVNLKIQKMYHCLLQDFDKEASEKKCYVANKDLLYIAEDWLKLDENILFVLFYEDPAEFLTQKISISHEICFSDILHDWLEYNNLILEFCSKNKDKCILMNYKNYDVSLSRYLNEKYGIYLDYIHRKENNIEYKNRKLFDLLLGYLIDNNYQYVKNVYEKLEKLSLNPVHKTSIFSKDIEREIIDLFYLIEANSLLREKENESLLEFIFGMQEDIERLYHDNQSLNQSKTALKNQLNETQSQISLLSFHVKYGTAKSRIQDQLSYKLGQAMIVNSKSIFGCLLMPMVLLSIVVAHRQSKKVYQEKIKKDPSLKLPSIERYPDYDEVARIKNYFSYKLGQILISHFKNPLMLLKLPYQIIKEHKKIKYKGK